MKKKLDWVRDQGKESESLCFQWRTRPFSIMRHSSQTSFTNHPPPHIFLSLDMEIDERMLGELEGMGFDKTLAAKALSSSGNSSIEDAVNWLVDHEEDASTNETPMEPEILEDIIIEASHPIQISQLVKLRVQHLRDQAREKRVEQEKKLDREREKERIRSGKELLEAKRMMEESERKRFLAQRKADKEEERRARERIRQKLQQDKLERRGMLGLPREVPPPVNTESPQETNNPQPVDSSETPASARECMRECLRSLKRQNKDDNTKAMIAFQTLYIYVRNMFKDPDEAKFRKIRLSNPIFQERVGRFEEGVKFLELCGFERVEGGKFLFLPRERVDRGTLKCAATELHNALTNPYFGLFSA